MERMVNWRIIETRLLSHPAPLIIMVGVPDSGKTDFALWFTDRGFEYGLIEKCATNISVDDDRFLKLTSLESYLYWLRLYKSVPKMVILDEADERLTNLDTVTKLSKSFRVPFAFQIRKYRAKLIMIYHRLTDVPELYLDHRVTIAFVKKVSKKYAQIKSDLLFGLIGEDHLELDNVPRTSIPFKTYAVGQFTEKNEREIDMLKELSKAEYLKRHGYDEEQIKAILREGS
ncbi:hypothetical protein MUP46_02400 [Patescibacteria group bacterium]|nr:hypothetical protein [Patescibacteria group bacterium]